MATPMIETESLCRDFGDRTVLDSVNIRVDRGQVLGLLGHNGAGKTTLVRLLTTMLPPSAGSARVAGLDVVRDSHKVRRLIGLTGQYASIDGQLSGRENLIFIARLLGASRSDARRRADELLELFELTGASRRKCRTYSGGMRRRLDLAASLVGNPELLFLDEPTTGLDPVSRGMMWDLVEHLVYEGTTVLLTTQYLEEADRLADRITVLAGGRVVAEGTATKLKSDVGQGSVRLTVADTDQAVATEGILRQNGHAAVIHQDGLTVVAPIERSADVVHIARALDVLTIEITDLEVREPTLEDVYLAFAGQPTKVVSGSIVNA